MSRLDRLNARRTDDSVITAKMLNEAYRHIGQSESVKYVVGAMQPIDPEYTKNTYAQGDRVKNQLDANLENKCEYKYQGSVTNDTHIKAKSDLDLLVIIYKFFSLESPQVPEYPYNGNPIQDLLDLREDAKNCLRRAFPEVSIDTSSSKCITLSGGSLTREIDVVPANWFNTLDYAKYGDDYFRGVQILDAKNKTRIKNTPFLHNAWIQHKDNATNGGLRKAARLLKSLSYDTESIELSSYDLVSIAYNMDEDKLNLGKGQELMLLNNCLEFCNLLSNNEYIRDSLFVPDHHRKIFADGHATQKGLNQLVAELTKLSQEVLTENIRSFRRLAEARVEY